MFSNRFNTKNDPLLEAVKGAMQDGDLRRQAVALVNEAFGVYNRNAIVNEDKADYDAAIEEVYADLKEAVQLDEISRRLATSYKNKATHDYRKRDRKQIDLLDKADETESKKKFQKYVDKADYLRTKNRQRMSGIDMADDKLKGRAKVNVKEAKLADKDGKIESPKDEVWGSRLRAAKLAGKMEESAHKALTAAGYKAGPKDSTTGFGQTYSKGKKSVYVDADDFAHFGSGSKATVTHGSKETAAHLNRGKLREEEQIDEISKDLAQRYREKASKFVRKAHSEAGKHSSATTLRGKQGQMEKKAEGLRKAGQRLGGIDLATKKFKDQAKVNATSKYHKEETQVDEAAYSAKAARAGKDIGKPGKMFSKIASKAGKKYGSEERGRKVAGAILAKIRAKHLREQSEVTSALPKDEKGWRGVETPRDYTADEARQSRLQGSAAEIKKDKYPGL